MRNRTHQLARSRNMVLILLLALIASCGAPAKQTYTTPPADKVTPAEKIRDIQQKQADIQPKIFQVKDLVDGLTIENVVATKPQIQQLIGAKDSPTGIIPDFLGLSKTTGELVLANVDAVKHTQSTEAENAKLKDAHRNAQKKTLEGWGYLFLIPGIIVLILAISLPYIPGIGPVVSPFAKPAFIVAACCVAVGITFLTLATFLLPIEIVWGIALGIAGLVGIVLGVLWLIHHLSTTKADAVAVAAHATAIAVDVVKSIDAGKAAGQIIFTDAAKDPKTSIVTAYQSTATARFINDVQGKPAPNLAAPVNGPQNGEAK